MLGQKCVHAVNVSYGKTTLSGLSSIHPPQSLKRNSRILEHGYDCTDTTLVRLVMDHISYQFLSRSTSISSAPSFFKGLGLTPVKERPVTLLLLKWRSRIHLHKNALKSMDEHGCVHLLHTKGLLSLHHQQDKEV